MEIMESLIMMIVVIFAVILTVVMLMVALLAYSQAKVHEQRTREMIHKNRKW